MNSCEVHRLNSPSFSRGWLDTEGHAGCSGLRGRLIDRRDSSLHPCPHNSGGLWVTDTDTFKHVLCRLSRKCIFMLTFFLLFFGFSTKMLKAHSSPCCFTRAFSLFCRPSCLFFHSFVSSFHSDPLDTQTSRQHPQQSHTFVPLPPWLTG